MFAIVFAVVAAVCMVLCFSWGRWLWISHVELEIDIANERDEVKSLKQCLSLERERVTEYRVELSKTRKLLAELSKTRKLLAESVARENRVRVALNHEGWE